MTSVAAAPHTSDVRPALAAVRGRLGLVALLFALAALAWWSTVDRMAGMDMGPGTDLGALGWFTGVWVVMMAAMMFPSVAPVVALYARMTKGRHPLSPLLFAGGYLLTWTVAGLLAFGAFRLGRELFGSDLAWTRGGQWFAGGVVLVAALYELTPLKEACLSRCRSPIGFLLGNWRDGLRGGLTMGVRHGAWCVGCCWALMAALFALGVMSVAASAFVAGLIALEKTLPWRRAAMLGTTAVLVVLAVLLWAAPDAIPGLTIPTAHPAGGMMMP